MRETGTPMTTSRALNRVRIALLSAAALVAAGLSCVLAAPAQAATQGFDLWAVTGTATMAVGQPAVTVWGYQPTNTAATRPGGPTLTVTVGDVVNITLHNEVGEPTGLLVQGQSMVPDLTGVGDGGQTTYSFTAGRPGTFLYEAAPLPNAQHQTAMGLHGALVVLPTTAGQAYGDPSTAYDDDEVLVLGEIDPALSNAANPAAFDMRKFAPKYFTINGLAYPNTTPITAAADSTELLRYVNAGVTYHSMGVLGAGQTMIALDGAPLADARHFVAETIGPGQTADALVETPAAPTTTADVELSVYDTALSLHNTNTAGVGGMLTSIHVAGTAGPGDTTGPVVSGAAVNTGTLTATADDGNGHGGSTIAAAEFYLDDVTGAPSAMSVPGGSSGEVSASITVPAGDHVVYVRAQDGSANANWGPFTSVLISGADESGPTTSSPLLSPNLVNNTSTSGVAVTATADDSASGGSVITAAEYAIDALPAEPMSVNSNATVASIDATIPTGVLDALSEGVHVISVRAKDTTTWGLPATVNLTVDEHGPTTTGVTVAPTPNNGTVPFNSSVPAVRVIATGMSDPVFGGVNSPIATAEAFIDTPGANGSGIRLIASDGVFSDTSEGGYLDIPLATVAALTNGPHTVFVHAKDAAGNWGSTGSGTILVDKTRPVVNSVTATPNPTSGATAVTLTASGTDPAPASTGVTKAEWWRGADPGVGNGAPMTPSVGGFTASVPVIGLSDTSHQLNVRVRDAAGNWSTPGSTALSVTVPLYYSTLGNSNPPGVGGAADDSDIYLWSGAAHSRSVDLSTLGVPGAANVDGYSRGAGATFYVSFAADTNLTGLGAVQDEDVVRWNGSAWSVFFNGTAHGLTAANLDLDAINVAGSMLYFSTLGNSNPPGVGGAADDADIYSWDGTSYARVFDASANGIPGAANVDGYDRVDATHFYLSFAADTTLTGPGAVQDEDVIYSSAGTRSVYFDGTAHGLTANNLDVDAFDVP
jgi:Multicopper oxidase